MTDLNTAIAVFKGKLPFPKDRCPVCGWKYADDDYGCKPDNCSMRPQQPSPRADQICIPDYEHDANLYMALFEEMPDECFIQKINNRLYGVGKIEGMGVKTFSRNSAIGTAICQAYCKIHGLDV